MKNGNSSEFSSSLKLKVAQFTGSSIYTALKMTLDPLADNTVVINHKFNVCYSEGTMHILCKKLRNNDICSL